VDALTTTREEWAANAERSVRLACYSRERIPAGHAVYTWTQEAEELGRELAAKTRTVLTARLGDATGQRAVDIRSRRLNLGRYAKAGEWGEVAATIRRALNHELADVDTATLAYDLACLEKLVRERTAAIYALAEELTKQAIEAEIARRATDEAWQRELKRRDEIKAYLNGSRRITR